jgi:hypothetical protein
MPPETETLKPPAAAPEKNGEEKRETEETEGQEPHKPAEEEHLETVRRNQENISPENPRFKEVYGKMKTYEAALSEREKDIEVIRAHNARLAARLDEIEKNKADRKADPPPDPTVDPEGYKKWHEYELARKDKEYRDSLAAQRVQTMIEIEQGLHEDYAQVITAVEREMERDPKLKKEIWESPNPARAAYKYGRKKMDERQNAVKEETERQERLEQTKVERANAPAAPKEEATVTDGEKRVIRNLFPDLPYKEAEKKYLTQKKAMGR